MLSHVWVFCDPMDSNPPRLLCPWDFPGKNTGVGCHFFLQGSSRPRDETLVSCLGRQILYHWVSRKGSEVAQLCPTLCDPVDCSLPGSSVQGISQARILEWVAISFSRGSSLPRDQTQVFCIAGRHFTVWASREAFYFAPIPCTLKSISSEFCFYNCKKKKSNNHTALMKSITQLHHHWYFSEHLSDPFLARFARPSLRLSHSPVTFSRGVAALTSSSSILEFQKSSLSGISHRKWDKWPLGHLASLKLLRRGSLLAQRRAPSPSVFAFLLGFQT